MGIILRGQSAPVAKDMTRTVQRKVVPLRSKSPEGRDETEEPISLWKKTLGVARGIREVTAERKVNYRSHLWSLWDIGHQLGFQAYRELRMNYSALTQLVQAAGGDKLFVFV